MMNREREAFWNGCAVGLMASSVTLVTLIWLFMVIAEAAR